jgi:hypothetical protein
MISVEMGREEIERNEFHGDLDSNFPDKETLILDGCFFCPLIIDYKVSNTSLWRMYYTMHNLI